MFEKLSRDRQRWVENLFAQMTETEKIGQTLSVRDVDVKKAAASDIPAFLEKYPVGSISLGNEMLDTEAAPVEGVRAIQKQFRQAALKIPLLYAADCENALGSQISGFTMLPRTMSLGATFSEQDAYDSGTLLGSEMRELNIRWTFGPVVDLNLEPNCPESNIRSIGDNPEWALRLLKSMIRGLQSFGTAACLKHFPGEGTDTRNSHLVTIMNTLSMSEWRKYSGRVFKELIDDGAMSIMTAHMAFPAYEEIDPVKKRWRPATLSRTLTTDLLRGELGFKGVVATDALVMNGFNTWAPWEERVIDTFNSGADILLWLNIPRYFELIHTALYDGRISQKTLDEMVFRILSFKAALDLDKQEATETNNADLPPLLRKNGEIAKRISEDSITLLRNRDGILPLKLKAGAKLLVFMDPNHPKVKSHLGVFAREMTRRGYQVTSAVPSDHSLLANFTDAFDMVFYLCDANPLYGTHSGANMMLWPIMSDENIKKLVMISFATPYFLEVVESASTYINAYHDSENTILATIKAMFGEIPFKGRSPVGLKLYIKHGEGLIL